MNRNEGLPPALSSHGVGCPKLPMCQGASESHSAEEEWLNCGPFRQEETLGRGSHMSRHMALKPHVHPGGAALPTPEPLPSLLHPFGSSKPGVLGWPQMPRTQLLLVFSQNGASLEGGPGGRSCLGAQVLGAPALGTNSWWFFMFLSQSKF